MKTAPFAGLALGLALLPWSPTPQDPARQRRPLGVRQKAEIERLEKEVLGLWRLVHLRTANTTFQGGAVTGYLLVAPEYMSIEFHVENNLGSDFVDYLFQSGIFEYRFSALGELTAIAMIGTNGADTDEIDINFEPAGRRRTYRVKLTPEEMTLERTDSTLRFIRVARPPEPPEPPKAAEVPEEPRDG